MTPALNQPVPNFTLPNQDKASTALADYKGKNVILYFYPKDDTPGCTLESCGFRDVLPQIAALGGIVLGVSKDSPASHQKFIAKYDLNFPLLSDESGEICTRFGVLQQKSMFGKKYMGIDRSTFLIDGQGILRREWRSVSVMGHIPQVLSALKEIQGA